MITFARAAILGLMLLLLAETTFFVGSISHLFWMKYIWPSCEVRPVSMKYTNFEALWLAASRYWKLGFFGPYWHSYGLESGSVDDVVVVVSPGNQFQIGAITQVMLPDLLNWLQYIEFLIKTHGGEVSLKKEYSKERAVFALESFYGAQSTYEMSKRNHDMWRNALRHELYDKSLRV